VDDDQVLQQALTAKLKSLGYDVLQADDGAAAVATVRKHKPDLILLDITFPPDVAHGGGVPWDGFLILNWLRRLDEGKDVPVVFISGCDATKHKTRALAAGAVSYFQKPFSADELLSVIAQELSAPKRRVESKKRILFIDDEGDWRFVAGTCLQDAGFEVLTAKDAAEAARRMETLPLDGIILDVNLAGENGLLLMELLKQKHPGVPVLIYTGLDHDAEAIQAMLRQGARQYLRKGSMTDLCNTLKTMVNSSPAPAAPSLALSVA
jgi:DNA-binding response OmpR family regulator